MKKVSISFATVLVLFLFCMSFASAEFVSSPTAPVVALETVEPSGEQDGLTVETLEQDKVSEATVELYEQIRSAVENNEAIFDEEELKAIDTQLPEDVEIAQLSVAEYIPIRITGYTEEKGDLTLSFSCPGDYLEGETLLAMFCVLGEEEEQWVVVEVVVEEGLVKILLTQELLMQMDRTEAVLLILRAN